MRAPDWLTARPVAHRGLHDRSSGIIENMPGAAQAAIDGNFAVNYSGFLAGPGTSGTTVVYTAQAGLGAIAITGGSVTVGCAANIDYVGIAPYFGCDAGTPSSPNLPVSWLTQTDGGLTSLFAAINTGGVAALPVLSGVERLIQLIDHDANNAGQGAAEASRQRWCAQGRTVVPLIPKQPGWDWNDVVLGRRA